MLIRMHCAHLRPVLDILYERMSMDGLMDGRIDYEHTETDDDLNDKPPCSQSCLFQSEHFLSRLDRVGLEQEPQPNFSASFLACRGPHVPFPPARQPVHTIEPNPTEEERTRISRRVYTQISKNQIRLLRLLPGNFADKLECTIQSHDIEVPARYEALSYTWGKPAFTARLSCSGVEFPITQNLYHALRYLRHAHESRLLWVDALCINQSDLEEVGLGFLLAWLRLLTTLFLLSY